jgi:hypothetical protein
MNRSTERLNAIYNKTDGYCHLCHRKLSFKNYGVRNSKGAWHIEHSIPRANGGTDHLNNLYAACIPCNEDKGTRHNRSVRKQNGVTRAPHCRVKKQQVREGNMTIMGGIGLLIGSGIGGPLGAFIGVVIGSEIGKGMSAKR